MPAINVARTDTFEVQRQKINQIGEILSNISAGGSDLQTGNLKLGDGDRTTPSLSFISDSTLGIYKPNDNTIGFVSSSKKLVDVSNSGFYTFKDLIVQQNILLNSNLSLLSPGQNYDAGVYENVSLIGGTGEKASLDITVQKYNGLITSEGENYNSGSYSNVSLEGGSGTGALASFDVDPIAGDITNSGTGYVAGNYQGVSLSDGDGTGAIATITVEGDSELSGTVTNTGTGYSDNIYSSIPLLNTPRQTFVLTTISNPGTPPPNEIYVVDGNNQPTLNLEIGNTYRFDTSDASMSGHPLVFQSSGGGGLDFESYITIQKGTLGTSGSFVDLIILPNTSPGTIEYACSNHIGMGGTINIVSGTIGIYGRGASANFEVIGGSVSNFTLSVEGFGYKTTDTLEIYPGDVGGSGSGFLYTIDGVVYNGEITNVEITNSGQNYNNGNVLSASASDLGGVGSGFEYTITSNPGKISNFEFVEKGENYQVGDTLVLPQGVSGLTTNLSAIVSGVSGTLTSASTTLVVTSTSGLVSGMTVDITDGLATIPVNTTIQNIINSTTIELSQPADSDGAVTLTFTSPGTVNQIILSDITGVNPGDFVTQTAGTGTLSSNTTVESVNPLDNSILLTEDPIGAGTATLSFSPEVGLGTTSFGYEIETLGSVESFIVNSSGNGYSVSDELTVNPFSLVQPITYTVKNINTQLITFTNALSSTYFSVGDFIEYDDAGITVSGEVLKVNVSGSNLDSVLIENINITAGSVAVKSGESLSLTTDTVKSNYLFTIDDEITPNLTLFIGNTYVFDFTDSSNSGHQFAFSTFRDGNHPPSLIENLNTTLDTNSTQITLPSTTGILEGMEVSVTSGDGEFLPGTTVLSIDSSTQITVSVAPTISGDSVVSFSGVEYTDNISRTSNNLTIKVTEDTPNLYYYCSVIGDEHVDEGGYDNLEALVTIDPNNPKIFGSGFLIRASSVSSSDVISLQVEDGNVITQTLESTEATFGSVSVTGSLNSGSIVTSVVSTPSITDQTKILLSSPLVEISSDLEVGENFIVEENSGDIFTNGEIKSTKNLNINDKLRITENTISSTVGNDIVLTPAQARVVKVNSTSALGIPSGTESDKPSQALSFNGYIRFNTTTNQYEGYSEANQSWSSLGGVRDLDGNTTILAEESVGSNDNTLWFINDNVNTVRFTPQYQEFVNVKKIRSVNTSAPDYQNWTANTPVNLGDYLKYRNNIFEVTIAGTTGTTGSEPTNITGDPFANGTATLQYFTTAVASLTFDEISEVRIDPLGFTNLVVNGELRFSKNKISSTNNDIIIQPTGSQKLVIQGTSSLVVPVGDSNSKGNPSQGSIRYNTTDAQFEGFNGAQWGGLGGVKDVDQDTKIEAETGPGNDEDILYFFNAGNNTLRLTTTQLEFDGIDTIESSGTDTFNINATTITFDSLSTTIDNSDSTISFISTSKDNLDFGLSTGITNDYLLRLKDTGDVVFNLGFGTGTPDNLTLINDDLTNFELKHIRVNTSKIPLVRGTLNSGNSTIYSIASESSAKVCLTAHNTTTGDKELVEYYVIDDGTDVYFTDTNNIKTGAELVSTVFDIDPSNNVRISFTLNTGLTIGDNVTVTIIKTVTKR
jgi:hypothetical protein